MEESYDLEIVPFEVEDEVVAVVVVVVVVEVVEEEEEVAEDAESITATNMDEEEDEEEECKKTVLHLHHLVLLRSRPPYGREPMTICNACYNTLMANRTGPIMIWKRPNTVVGTMPAAALPC